MKILPRLVVKLDPILTGDYITIQPTCGWSHYKEWPANKWEELVAKIQEGSPIPVYFIQIGLETDYKLIGCDHSFMGSSLMNSINLIANAKLHMGSDSMGNHLTHMTGTPAVILWGSTQVSASGYEENINISLGLPCQPCFKEDPRMSIHPRGCCNNPPGQTYENPQHACMSGITVDMVLNAIKAKLFQ